MQEVAAHVGPDTTFWEVGARWGYFSLAAASVVDSVEAFEVTPERVRMIRRSVAANGFENVNISAGEVGNEVDLDSHPTPDCILMDIEGYEYPVLSGKLELLDEHPTWIVELHDFAGVGHKPDEVIHDPHDVETLFASKGYDVTTLSERSQRNYHILATFRTDQ